MRLYNTLSREIEDFEAGTDVSLYVCGITPYDTTHLGHARTYVVFDVLIRHLLHHGHRVHYIQNITDVDESIVGRAEELDTTSKELGDHYTRIYVDDIAELGLIPAAAYPRASDVIPEIQEMIRRLLASGHAYRVDNDVFFRVTRVDSYGRLGRLSRDEMIAAERDQDGSTVDDERKEDPLDFPLWRAHDGRGPAWDSPWGRGRPGWHIECSTLAIKHLGKQLDVHGGGCDLVFPHHEAEIAQAEAVTGLSPFARHWTHVEMVRLGGEKMSKSLGNMVFVRDLLGRYTSDTLRLYLLRTPYREPLDFDALALDRSAGDAARLIEAAAGPPQPPSGDTGTDAVDRFQAALDDDLSTAKAVTALMDLAGQALAGEPGAGRTVRTLAARLGLNLVGPNR